jgi:hypothetical protein
MGAGHLHDESAFDLALRLGPFDECQAGVHSGFGNPAARQPSSRDQLVQGGLDERECAEKASPMVADKRMPIFSNFVRFG